MKRVFKIILLFLAIIVLGLLAYFLIARPRKTAVTAPSSSLPPTAEFVIPPPDAPKMSIPTEKETVDVNNLYSDPVYKLPDGTVTFIETSDYTMAFFPKDKSFTIAILSSDLTATRNKAENDFLQTLNITKDQACELTVTLGVPYKISAENSGLNFGLSFCPDGKAFE